MMRSFKEAASGLINPARGPESPPPPIGPIVAITFTTSHSRPHIHLAG